MFVLLWSTGFVGAKYGLPDADPFAFLAIRLAIASTVLGLAALATRTRLTGEQAGRAAVSGLLLHATYLGGVFFAISRGTPAGVSSVIVSLQPVLVAVLAWRLLGETLSGRQWSGLVVGVLGVALVLAPTLGGAVPTVGLLSCLVALAGGTVGTLWQKRHGDGIPLLAGTFMQYAVAAGVLGILSLVTERPRVQWTPRFAAALAYLVVALSIGAVLLLLALLRRGSAASVSTLLYLVPPATAVESFLLFDERLSAVSVVGIGVAALGVALVVAPSRRGVVAPAGGQEAVPDRVFNLADRPAEADL